jgi:uncharacterized surface protein with fasciclin (FAS1) repeats
MRYLRSEFAETDMREILEDSASRRGQVGYLDRILGGGGGDALVDTLRNGTISIERAGEDQAITANGTLLDQGDILGSNGVLHTLPSLLLPSGSLALTAEKYLLALDCTKFVELLHSVNLSHYVEIPSRHQDTSVPLPDPLPHSSSSQRAFDSTPAKEGYTILALKDSLLDSSSSFPRLLTLPSFPAPGSPELASLLSYHILPTKLTPRRLRDGMLMGTELRPDSLKGERQRLSISVQDEEGGEGEGWDKRTRGIGGKKKKKGEEKEVVIGFGNANAIAEPGTPSPSLPPPAILLTTRKM